MAASFPFRRGPLWRGLNTKGPGLLGLKSRHGFVRCHFLPMMENATLPFPLLESKNAFTHNTLKPSPLRPAYSPERRGFGVPRHPAKASRKTKHRKGKNIMSLQNIDHATASLSDLWRVATADMRASAEDFATATMARVANPICGAREIVMAEYLRSALDAERKSVAKLMKAFRA